jgi:hypothetical protein
MCGYDPTFSREEITIDAPACIAYTWIQVTELLPGWNGMDGMIQIASTDAGIDTLAD